MIVSPADEEGAARVAVLGAGVAGLSCAHALTAAGVRCDVYERWPGLGGQAATMDVGGGLRLERYYHYLFTSDAEMIALFERLGLREDLELHRSDAAIAIADRVWPFNGVGDLLRFRPVPLRTRLRMGAALAKMQLSGDLSDYQGQTARHWIERNMGAAAWEGVWGPLMRGKFGVRADDISMAWIWDKVRKRRSIREGEARQEAFLYPRDGFEPLFRALAERIEAGGGRVMIDRPAAAVCTGTGGLGVVPARAGSFRSGLDPRRFEADGPPRSYEAVVCCLPNDVFTSLLDEGLRDAVGREYLARLDSIEYLSALNLLLELEQPLTSHFWVNVADRRCPFVGLIEHTNFVGRERTAGRVFTHVTNYLDGDDELLGLELDQLLDRYSEGMGRISPGFGREQVRNAWLFREPAGQPVVDVGYPDRIPPRRTPVPGLWLVNTTQIYPEDRGTNYAVRDGERTAAELLADLGSP
jgi:protoporphyrinogen oxidase